MVVRHFSISIFMKQPAGYLIQSAMPASTAHLCIATAAGKSMKDDTLVSGSDRFYRQSTSQPGT
jgi:hypothetical protein